MALNDPKNVTIEEFEAHVKEKLAEFVEKFKTDEDYEECRKSGEPIWFGDMFEWFGTTSGFM